MGGGAGVPIPALGEARVGAPAACSAAQLAHPLPLARCLPGVSVFLRLGQCGDRHPGTHAWKRLRLGEPPPRPPTGSLTVAPRTPDAGLHPAPARRRPGPHGEWLSTWTRCSDSPGVPSLNLSSVLLHEPSIVSLCFLFCVPVDSSTCSCATVFPKRLWVTHAAGRPRASCLVRGLTALCVAQSLILMQ